MQKILLLGLIVFCLAAPQSMAAVIHVDVANVTGPEDGSEARPFNTIQEGIDNAGNNDTVLVADGVYRGAGNMNLGLQGKSLRLRSEDGMAATTIDCLGAGALFWLNSSESSEANLEVDGFTIRDSKPAAVGSWSYSITMRNCAIVDCGDGFACEGESSWEIVGCVITDGNMGLSCGDSSSVSISNCLIRNNGTGIFLWHNAVATVTNCVIVDSNGPGINVIGDASAAVINSTIARNISGRGGGIQYSCNPSSVPFVVKNTILWGNLGTAGNQIAIAAGPPMQISFCNVQGGQGEVAVTSVVDGIDYRNNINAEPLFANPENGDYSLLPGSPCIDAGTADGAPTTDIEGNPRPYGDFVDIGAYEYAYGDITEISFASQPPDKMAIDEVFQFVLLASGQELPATIAQWNVSSGIGNISNTGLFTATHVGVGTVTATLKSNEAIVSQSEPISVVPSSHLYQFIQSLPAGVSIFSLPLRPQEPLMASSLASDLGATVVIRAVDGQFRVYIPEIEFGDFVLEGGQGVIVNLLTPTDYTVQGYPWGTPIAAPTTAQTPTWAFAVAGRFAGTPRGSQLRVTNRRTNQQLLVPIEGSAVVATAFVDMSQHSVVVAGDEITVELIGPGNTSLSKPRRYVVSSEDISSAYLLFDMPFFPDQNRVLRNYPNPLNPETWIPYQLHDASVTGIDIYNVKGQLIRYLDLGYQQAGWYTSKERAAYWDGRDTVGEEVGSGIYFYRLRGHSSQGVQKLVVLR